MRSKPCSIGRLPSSFSASANHSSAAETSPASAAREPLAELDLDEAAAGLIALLGCDLLRSPGHSLLPPCSILRCRLAITPKTIAATGRVAKPTIAAAATRRVRRCCRRIIADEFVEGQRRNLDVDAGDCRQEVGIAQRQVPCHPGPTQVDIFGHLIEGFRQPPWQGVGAVPVEVIFGVAPANLAACLRDKQVIGVSVLEPPSDFTLHPFRGSGIGRGQQEEVLRIQKCRLDRRPQSGRDGKTGFVAKHPHGAQSVPRFREAVQRGP
ncbi:MAG: hypothetical protein U5R30_15945 [Deltaproteobacteria bacterium]|nr:hypothetical protein [Deltaproteobacteria bacterium]